MRLQKLKLVQLVAILLNGKWQKMPKNNATVKLEKDRLKWKGPIFENLADSFVLIGVDIRIFTFVRIRVTELLI